MSSLIGRQISQYLVLEELGRGGMGVAYRAEDVNLGRQVVLKVLPADGASQQTRLERFRREARACSMLQHPGITAIYEADEFEGISYICMEFVQGRTFRTVLGGERPTTLFSLRILTQVSAAVAAAHEQGIVHRDLKPENIMVTPKDDAKVLDFGLAAIMSPASREQIGSMPTQIHRLTTAGTRMGTPTYMSPEQARTRPVGPPSDVFSMGTILYEAIAGHPPFRGADDLAVMHAIVYDTPPPLRSINPETPADLESIVRRALKKDPGDRYPTAGLLHEDLTRCLAALQARMEEKVTMPRAAFPPPDISMASGRVQAARPPRPSLAGPGSNAARRTGPATDSPLVGREPEFEQLKVILDEALDGRGQVVLVSGEAGIGKSRLVNEGGLLFESVGATYVTGSCLFREGGLPYHPFVEAAERLVTMLGVEEAHELEEFVTQRMPSLRGRLPILLSFLHLPGVPRTAFEPAASREHLLDAIAAFFVQVARERPLLVHIEDLHWADEGTLDLFRYLGRGFGRTCGVLVGTYRPEEAGELVARVSAGDPCVHVQLDRLGSTETAGIVQALLPGARVNETFLDRLHRETAGNPFFLLEAIRLLRSEGLVREERGRWLIDAQAAKAPIPGRVHEVLARRLTRLSSAERQLLEAAACEGMSFRSSTLVAALSRERYEILSSLQALEREHRLVRTENDHYRFDHPMIRETLYEETIPELRCEYHSRIANHLIDLSGGRLLAPLSPAQPPGTEGRPPSASSIAAARERTEAAAIAYQLLEAREESRAVPYLLVAASHARTLFANREAESSFDRAIAILEAADAAGRETSVESTRWRIKAHKDRGRIRVRVGEFDAAWADFQQMRAIARGAALHGKEAHAENLLADLAVRTGDYKVAGDHARRATELAEKAGDRHSLASALAVTGIINFNRGAFDLALAAHSRAVALQQSINDSAGYADSLNKIGNIHLRQGRTEEALAAYSTALGVARKVEHRLNEAEALNNIGAVHHERGEFDEALRHYEDSLRLKREIGDRRSIARSLNNIGLLREARGKFGEALAAHEESLALKRELGDQAGISSSLNNMGSLFEQMGEYGRALACCEESLAIKETIGETLSVPYCQNALGRVRLVLNDLSEAEALFREALKETRQQGDRTEECRAQANLSRALLMAGRLDEAREALEEVGRLAKDLGLREMLVEILYMKGLAGIRGGDPARFREALEVLREILSKTPFAQGAVYGKHLEALGLKLAGRMDEAREAFDEAISRVRKIGLRGLEWKVLHDAGRSAEARAALEVLAAKVPEGEVRDRFLGSTRARKVLEAPSP